MITSSRIDKMLERTVDSGVSTDPSLSLVDAVARNKLPVIDLSGLGANELHVDSFKNFLVLRKCDLSDNALTVLPDGIFGKTENRAPVLSWLQLSINMLQWKGIKPLATLEHLVTLNLNDNKLTRFPNVLSKGLVKLKALVLSRNKLESFTLSNEMKNLNSLVLSHNQITTLSTETLQNLPRLAKISLSNNAFATFPDITPCTSLAEIRIAYNEIDKINVDLQSMDKLKLVDVGHNKLASVEHIRPFAVTRSLWNLNVSGNGFAEDIGESEMFKAFAERVLGMLKQVRLKTLNGRPLEKFGLGLTGRSRYVYLLLVWVSGELLL